ncbi:hypothetical protein D9758_015733 [Tetrapyrgos nigripes]|uniref:MYND-type domain-containing protein n=1 Tax=Tetrapyrgos nigripes TaxID=182062 RepID=A0A8H5CSH0_9AGAR|nr:hypothetical protein D9758_015733 [Tetrapyrgos nigripes]
MDPSLFPTLVAVFSSIARTRPPQLEAEDKPAISSEHQWATGKSTIDLHVKALEEHVTGLWSWLSYVLDQFLERDTWQMEHPDLYQSYSFLSINVIANFMVQEPWRRCLFRTPDFTHKLTWMLLRSSSLEGENTDEAKTISYLLDAFDLFRKDSLWDVEKKKVAVVLLENPTRSTYTAYKPLITYLRTKGKGISLVEILQHVHILFSFWSTDWSIQAEMAKRGGLAWSSKFVANVFGQLCQLKGFSQDPYNAKLWQASKHSRTYTLTKNTIIRCVEVLTLHTPQVEILRSIARAIGDVKDRSLHSELHKVNGDTGGNVPECIFRLYSVFEDRNRLFRGQARLEYKRTLTCDNGECQRRAYADSDLPEGPRSLILRRCTGCFGQIYCSEACQKRSWKRRHREQCKRSALAYRKLFESPSIDLRFFVPSRTKENPQLELSSALLTRDIHRYSKEVCESVQQRPACPPDAKQPPIFTPIIRLDYGALQI